MLGYPLLGSHGSDPSVPSGSKSIPNTPGFTTGVIFLTQTRLYPCSVPKKCHNGQLRSQGWAGYSTESLYILYHNINISLYYWYFYIRDFSQTSSTFWIRTRLRNSVCFFQEANEIPAHEYPKNQIFPKYRILRQKISFLILCKLDEHIWNTFLSLLWKHSWNTIQNRNSQYKTPYLCILRINLNRKTCCKTCSND